MEYQYVEVLHASIQIVLAIFGILFGAILIHHYYKEVDVKRKKAKKSSNMYSIEYSPQVLNYKCLIDNVHDIFRFDIHKKKNT